MKTNVLRKRLETQGYVCYTDKELHDHQLGIRFAYGMCITFVSIGLVLSNIYVLAFAMAVAFMAIILPRHPFDYVFNYGVRFIWRKPEVPNRTVQGKFACAIATVWLGLIIYSFAIDNRILAYALGGMLLFVGSLVTFLDICIPSILFNALMKKRNKSLA